MTTDITELAQSLKSAAEKATQGNWRAFQYHDGRCGIGGGHHDEIMVCEHISKERPHDAMFIALANPANILALVEALEKAQQRIAAQREYYEGVIADGGKRIAELESRTVTVKQGEVLVTVAGFTGCGKSAIAGEIEIAMKAIGVPVTWANGDSEKRMTGADWLAAIEMYKPTVRIVEENIPRAAGIKVEAE
ncbi:TPA: ead/Ea22-like family protein [Klebsiella pneumoniae]|nr:ead/Ea22-like family protein [Klebsiella pneumoniae]